MTDASTEQLTAIVEPVAEAMGFEIVRVSFGGGNRPVLQVMAERSDGSMTVEDCARLSRELSVVLDVENPVSGRYDLEISSPGIDRPLTRLKDFDRFAGFDAKLELFEPVGGHRRWRGLLAGVEEGRVTLVRDQEKHHFGFGEIKKAKLVLTDALLAQSASAQDEK